MPIPDYQTLMRPLLAQHVGGGERSRRSIRDGVAAEFELTPDELDELLPSGSQSKYQNRVNWAVVYLVRAGLLESPRRGLTRITLRGEEMLLAHPERIDNIVLDQFPEFREFRFGDVTTRHGTPAVAQPTGAAETPEERLEIAHEELKSALAEELLARLLARDDVFFEHAVLDVLVGMGYGGSKREAAERVGRSGDGGIDGVIREDRLGLDAIYIQAKRWSPDRHVGPRDIREFVGALQDAGAAKGVFITTSRFSQEALALAERRRIVLIPGRQLANLMIEAKVGVDRVRSYELSRIDEEYFSGDDDGASTA
jgi:restriction system protein